MKKNHTHLNALAAIMTSLTLSAISANAALLSIDFTNGGPTEAGFTGQTVLSQTHGSITVSSTGQQGLFDRGVSGGTNNDLYRDFLFDNNSNGFTLALSGAGIDISTDYIMTFYAYDRFDGSRSTTITGTSGTTGGPLGPVSGTADPAALDDYAVTGTFTSDGTGNLTFAISGNRTVINGFEIDAVPAAVPEPSTTALLGLSGLAMILRRRK